MSRRGGPIFRLPPADGEATEVNSLHNHSRRTSSTDDSDIRTVRTNGTDFANTNTNNSTITTAGTLSEVDEDAEYGAIGRISTNVSSNPDDDDSVNVEETCTEDVRPVSAAGHQSFHDTERRRCGWTNSTVKRGGAAANDVSLLGDVDQDEESLPHSVPTVSDSIHDSENTTQESGVATSTAMEDVEASSEEQIEINEDSIVGEMEISRTMTETSDFSDMDVHRYAFSLSAGDSVSERKASNAGLSGDVLSLSSDNDSLGLRVILSESIIVSSGQDGRSREPHLRSGLDFSMMAQGGDLLEADCNIIGSTSSQDHDTPSKGGKMSTVWTGKKSLSQMQMKKNPPVTTQVDLDDTVSYPSTNHDYRDPLSVGAAQSYDFTVHADFNDNAVTEVDHAMRRGTSMAYSAEHSVVGKTDENTIETGSQKEFPSTMLHPDCVSETASVADDEVDDFKMILAVEGERKKKCLFVFLFLLIILTLAAIGGGVVCVTSSCTRKSPSQQNASGVPQPMTSLQPPPQMQPSVATLMNTTIAVPSPSPTSTPTPRLRSPTQHPTTLKPSLVATLMPRLM